jgi:hypothetical protein
MIVKQQPQGSAVDQGAGHRYVLEICRLDRSERKRELRKAAERGYPAKMHELALACDDPAEREHWLREAARNGWQEAIVELAESEC